MVRHEVSDEQLIARHIHPLGIGEGPERARLKRTGVSVWIVIGYLQGTGWDVDGLMRDYALTRDEVAAARGYYQRYQSLIDAQIALNSAYLEA